MAMMSRGEAPSAFSARTTASSVVPSSSETSRASVSFTSTLVFGTTVVSPVRENAFGCETSYLVLIFTERLPCATAAAAIRTSPPTTTVPVRSLMTTRAAASVRTGSSSRRAISIETLERY